MQKAAETPASGKSSHYRELARQVEAVVDGVDDEVALMASVACLVHEATEVASWTGFYRVVGDDLLRIGPYQGPLGCLEISFGSGVCGTVAAEGRSRVVDDVHAFPGHIACDASARSEIVIPIFRKSGQLFAVLDLDSRQPASFDDEDRVGLEAVAEILRQRL